MRPRWADAWDYLATAAALMRDGRASKPDADAWACLAADWQWIITHQRPDAPAVPRAAIVEAIGSAATRDRTALNKAGVPILAPGEYRGRFPEETLMRLDKLELLETLLWHERLVRFGRPIVLVVTEWNIGLGRPSWRETERAIASATPAEKPAPPPPPEMSPARKAAATPAAKQLSLLG